jgi:hypothetical protein
MKVRVSELRQAANVLFDHLERTGHAEIEVDSDYYWSIPKEKLYSVYENPSDFTVGQLSEDWENVRAIGAGRKDPIAYGLVWLSTILRFVGSNIVA